MKAKHGPPLCSEGDEGEWARVTKVQVSTPCRHFREGGNPERQSSKHGPPLCSEGDEGEGEGDEGGWAPSASSGPGKDGIK